MRICERNFFAVKAPNILRLPAIVVVVIAAAVIVRALVFGWDCIIAIQPAMKIDLTASRGAKRAFLNIRGLRANRAFLLF